MLVSNQIQEVFIMLTYEKVLEVFKDYLAEDDSCEVLIASQGYLVVDWDSRKNDIPAVPDPGASAGCAALPV